MDQDTVATLCSLVFFEYNRQLWRKLMPRETIFLFNFTKTRDIADMFAMAQALTHAQRCLTVVISTANELSWLR